MLFSYENAALHLYVFPIQRNRKNPLACLFSLHVNEYEVIRLVT